MSIPLKTLIVEDDTMTRKIIEKFVAQTETLEWVGSSMNGMEAANFLAKNEVDLILLDVEMPGLSGVELLQSLQYKPSVIMITSKTQYAVNAFDLEVADYIVKPLEYPRFLKGINKVFKQHQKQAATAGSSQSLFVKVDGQYINIAFKDIQFIESKSDYVTIHTQAKRYTIYATMKGVLEKLPAGDFERVHRSFIVPLQQIQSFEDNTLNVSGKLIPVGVTYRDRLISRLNLL
jgi:DNA-binding LytR/AlgR family response regulator